MKSIYENRHKTVMDIATGRYVLSMLSHSGGFVHGTLDDRTVIQSKEFSEYNRSYPQFTGPKISLLDLL